MIYLNEDSSMFLVLESYEWNEYFEIVLTIAKYGFLGFLAIVAVYIMWQSYLLDKEDK